MTGEEREPHEASEPDPAPAQRASTNAERKRKRKSYMADRQERERLAGLPTSWLTPKGRMQVLVAIVLLFLGAVSATTWCAVRYASDTAGAQALRVAPACADASTITPECVQHLTVFLDRVWNTDGGRLSNPSYFAALSGPAPANSTIQLVDPLVALPGDVADALVWRGQVVALLRTDDRDESVNAPDLAAGRDLNWLIASALWCLALAGSLLSMYTRLAHSPWRFATAVPAIATITFTGGAFVGSDPNTDPAIGIFLGAVFFGFFAIITALAARQVHRQGRLF